MGVVIRPMAFARVRRLATPRRRRGWLSRSPIPALIVAGFGMMAILTIAGAAFAVRTLLVLCFATLAGRSRWFGLPRRAV